MIDKGFNSFKPADGDQLVQLVFIVGPGIWFLGLLFAFEVVERLADAALDQVWRDSGIEQGTLVGI